MEAGFDYENAVFGGAWDFSEKGCMAELDDWPGISLLSAYLHRGNPIGIYAPQERAQLTWIVPKRWILQFFSTAFWEEIYLSSVDWEEGDEYDWSTEALKVLKILAYRLRPIHCECSTCSSSKWDGKDIMVMIDDWSFCGHPRSPRCRAAGTERWPAKFHEPDAVEGVPESYTLLANNWIIPKEAAKYFTESVVVDSGWVDTRRHRTSKRGRKQKSCGRGMFAQLQDGSWEACYCPAVSGDTPCDGPDVAGSSDSE